MTFPPNLGPIAPERNPTPTPQYYQPSDFVITALSLGSSTTVTTAGNVNYVIGQQVRFLIPSYYGTFQLNNVDGYVTSIISATMFTVNVNSSNMNTFIASPTYGPTKPQIIAIGDVNTGWVISTGLNQTLKQTGLPGAFINVSPAPATTFV